MSNPFDVREVIEGDLYQGEDEEVAYTVTTTNVGSNPTNPSVAVYSKSGGTFTDVTTTNMPTGSPSAVGDVITLPALKYLTAGVTYRVEILFTISGNKFEHYFWVHGMK